MNCTTCGTPLEPNTRFCPKCGTPAAQSMQRNPAPSFTNEPPTIPPTPSPFRQPPSYQPPTQQWTSSSSQPPSIPPQQPSYIQGDRTGSNVGTLASGDTPPRSRRRRIGCLARSLITLVVLLIILGAGWFLVARPYLDNLAQTKLDSVLTDAVSHIPPEVAVLPPGTVPVSEKLLNNLLVLGSSPNDVVKNTQIHITSSQMRLEFQIFGFSCAVIGVPQVSQGHLTVTNVSIEGIASLILTPDELTTLINRHLADAQQRINHSITSVQLKDQEVDLVFGPQGGGTLPTLP